MIIKININYGKIIAGGGAYAILGGGIGAIIGFGIDGPPGAAQGARIGASFLGGAKASNLL